MFGRNSNIIEQSVIIRRDDEEEEDAVYPGAIDNYSIAGNF